jgi:hypothetical protein
MRNILMVRDAAQEARLLTMRRFRVAAKTKTPRLTPRGFAFQS